MRVRTNNVPRHFAYRYEVPASVLASDFDWLDEDEGGDNFFKYRGVWYHLSEFLRVADGGELETMGWEGYSADSFFSAVVIRVDSDLESLVCGLALSGDQE